jgi:hypothetical protein
MKMIYVFLCEEPVAFFVFVGLYDVELFFPKADERGVNLKDFGDFTNGVIQLFDFWLFVRHGS